MNTNCLFRVFYTICEQYKFLMHSIYHQARITKVGFWLARSFFFPLSIFFFFFFLRSYQILGLIFSHQPIVFFFSTSLSSRDFVCGKIATTALEIILCLQHVLEFHVKTECLSWWQGIFSPYLSLSNWLRLSWKYPQSEYSWLQSRLKRLLLYTFPARACSTSFFCYKHWFLGKSGCKFGLPYPYHNIR